MCTLTLSLLKSILELINVVKSVDEIHSNGSYLVECFPVVLSMLYVVAVTLESVDEILKPCDHLNKRY